MKELLALFWKICLLKAGPQDVPHSWVLLLIAFVINGVIGGLQLGLRLSWLTALWQALLVLSITCLFTIAVLQLRNVMSRLTQTLTALFATGSIINLIVLPILVVAPLLFNEAYPKVLLRFISLFYLSIVVFINLWIILVTTHIFRHALGVRFVAALLVTFALIGINVVVFKALG